MSVTIPGVPQNGGDLAQYLTSVENEIGWIPSGTTQLGQDLVRALETDNDPSTWVSFAGNALQTVWSALPEDIRGEMQVALLQLVNLGLNRALDAGMLASAAVGPAIDAVPLIGTVIKAVLILVNASVDYAKQIDGQNQLLSGQDYWAQRFSTINAYTHPDALVYQQMHVLNYHDYRSKGNEWRLRPSFDRSSGASDRIFLGSSGLADKGFCNKGVLLDCPGGSFFDWEDCHFDDNSDTGCYRRLGMSSLFYPFWSPAYSDKRAVDFSYGNVKVGTKTYPVSDERLNPNTLMMANQFALLSTPSVNLRVNAERLLKIRDRFQKFFLDQVKVYSGLLEIKNGIAPGTSSSKRLKIAARKETNYVPTQSRRDKFYFDSNGLIQVYPNTGIDPNDWGVRTKRGPQTPKNAAISVAQYNAVIGSTLAFMSARANFLRSGQLMAALVNDYGAGAFDAGARKAMVYAANYGKPIPPPSMQLRLKAVKANPRRLRKPLVAAPTSGSGGGGGVVLVGAAAAALLLLKGRM